MYEANNTTIAAACMSSVVSLLSCMIKSIPFIWWGQAAWLSHNCSYSGSSLIPRLILGMRTWERGLVAMWTWQWLWLKVQFLEEGLTLEPGHKYITV